MHFGILPFIQPINSSLNDFRPIGTDAQVRSVRKPENTEIPSSISYTEFKVNIYTNEVIMKYWGDIIFQDENGQIQPIYKYYKKNPHGYSG